ncbi:cytochrome P450 [Novosphingobium colocasiae]
MTTNTLSIDLKNPDLYVDAVPHAVFDQLRRDDPVHWNPESDGPGFWALTRYEDIVEVSRNPALFSSAYENGGHRIFNENEVGLTGAGEAAIGIPFISVDPPVHTQYRKFIMPAVSPGRLAGIEGRIRERCLALIDKIPLGEAVDMVPLLSAPLPLLTLCELFDLPTAMWTDLYHWTNAFVGEDDPDFRQSPRSDDGDPGRVHDLRARAVRHPPRQPRRGSRHPARDDGSERRAGGVPRVPRQHDPRAGGGANETTRNSLSHTMTAFAAHPEQWDAVRAEPELLRNGVREMVRHASPVMHMRRTAMADTVVGGRPIRKGDKVVMWYIAANRDESVFPDPHRFDIRRGNIQHLGFGTGQHVCVGSRLAEMQLRVAFGILAERVSQFTLLAPRAASGRTLSTG